MRLPNRILEKTRCGHLKSVEIISSSLKADTDYFHYYKNRNRIDNTHLELLYETHLYRVSESEFYDFEKNREREIDGLYKQFRLTNQKSTFAIVRRRSKFLAHAVEPRLAVCLMLRFCREKNLSSPFEKPFFDQIKENLQSTLSNFESGQLSEDEKEYYQRLFPLEKIAFRILRSLAYFKSGGKWPSAFFISANDLQRRMSLAHPEDAARLLKFLCTTCVSVKTKGTHFRTKRALIADGRQSIKPIATEYKWRFQPYSRYLLRSRRDDKIYASSPRPRPKHRNPALERFKKMMSVD